MHENDSYQSDPSNEEVGDPAFAKAHITLHAKAHAKASVKCVADTDIPSWANRSSVPPGPENLPPEVDVDNLNHVYTNGVIEVCKVVADPDSKA